MPHTPEPHLHGNTPTSSALRRESRSSRCWPGPRSFPSPFTPGSRHDPARSGPVSEAERCAQKPAWHLLSPGPQGHGDKRPKDRLPRDSLAVLITVCTEFQLEATDLTPLHSHPSIWREREHLLHEQPPFHLSCEASLTRSLVSVARLLAPTANPSVPRVSRGWARCNGCTGREPATEQWQEHLTTYWDRGYV